MPHCITKILLFLSSLEVILCLYHLDLALPVVPRPHDSQSVDEEVGAYFDAIIFEYGNELFFGEDLRRKVSTLSTLLSEPCWSSAVGDFGS